MRDSSKPAFWKFFALSTMVGLVWLVTGTAASRTGSVVVRGSWGVRLMGAGLLLLVLAAAFILHREKRGVSPGSIETSMRVLWITLGATITIYGLFLMVII